MTCPITACGPGCGTKPRSCHRSLCHDCQPYSAHTSKDNKRAMERYTSMTSFGCLILFFEQGKKGFRSSCYRYHRHARAHTHTRIDIMGGCCRICLHDEPDSTLLISPCRCNGTQKHVHRKCLQTWINSV